MNAGAGIEDALILDIAELEALERRLTCLLSAVSADDHSPEAPDQQLVLLLSRVCKTCWNLQNMCQMQLSEAEGIQVNQHRSNSNGDLGLPS